MRHSRRMFVPVLLTAGVVALVIGTVGAQRRPSPSDAFPSALVSDTGPAGARSPSGFTQTQIENMEARIAAATALVSRLEGEAKARGLASGWRQATLETLLPLSLAGLRQVEQRAAGLDALAIATAEAADDPGVLGDNNADLVYTPITPCRFIDTRFYAAGKINGVRGFDVDLTGATYGGLGGCNPTTLFGVSGANAIGALAMNVTVFDTSAAGAPGFVAAKPNAAAPTTSLLNWYDQGASVQAANQGIVSLDQSGAANEFVIQTSGSVHIIVDIFGAFIEPEATALQQTFPVSATVIVPANSGGTATSPACPAGYSVTGGSCIVSGNFLHFQITSRVIGNTWFCSSRNTQPAANGTLEAEAICSRVPGR